LAPEFTNPLAVRQAKNAGAENILFYESAYKKAVYTARAGLEQACAAWFPCPEGVIP
jgi:hypothetical protein